MARHKPAEQLPAYLAASGVQPDPARRLQPGEPRYHSLWRERPPGAYYDAATGESAATFFPAYCRLTTDEWAGRPFTLQPWQADWIIKPAFGWRRADGTRLYRRVIVWVPRKNGKTELMAGVSHLCLLGDAVHGAECYAIASSGNQAGIVFKAAAGMVAFSPELAEQYETFSASLFARATHGKFEALTAKSRGKHGLRTTYLIGDEVHEWPDDQLYTFVRNAMASRREPMEWLISTAGVEVGYGVQLWEESLGICEGTFEDPETLVLIWCAPQDAKAEIDITDPRVWAEANPNLGVSLRREYMETQSRAAAQSTANENTFKRYHLNIWTGQTERWLPMTGWNACNTGGTDRWLEMEEELAGRECYGGLDLASTKDMNALVWLFPPKREGERLKLLSRFWWPDRTLRVAASKSRVPFGSWAKVGAIETTSGNAVDHARIQEVVLEDAERFVIKGLAIDSFNAHGVATGLLAAGVPVHLVRFAILSMTQPSKELERLVLTEGLDHGGHPVLRWQAANVEVRTDQNGNIMPTKRRATAKIDGIAATVMGLAMMQAEPTEPDTYLASGSLVVI